MVAPSIIQQRTKAAAAFSAYAAASVVIPTQDHQIHIGKYLSLFHGLPSVWVSSTGKQTPAI